MNVQTDREPHLGRAVTYPDRTFTYDLTGQSSAMRWFFDGPPTLDTDGQFLPDVEAALGRMETLSGKRWPEKVRANALTLTQAKLWPGRDFTISPYIGDPQTIEQCAKNATRNGVRGVELWSMAKSFAGKVQTESGEERTLILTGPGDLKFKKTGLVAGQVGEIIPLSEEELLDLGFVPGTVGPIGALSIHARSSSVDYLFDRDITDHNTRDTEKNIYISGGDTGWSIAVDLRKLIAAVNRNEPIRSVSDICERGPELERVFARRDITLLSGDSAQTGDRYYGMLEAKIRTTLQEADAYFGDDSLPDLDMSARRRMGGTGSLVVHGDEVVAYADSALHALPASQRERLVAFTSNAANVKSVTEPVAGSLKDRADICLITAEGALSAYIKAKEPESVVVFGLPDVVEQYPDQIGETKIVKGKGKIEEMMQIARAGTEDQKAGAAIELKNLIGRTARTQMADRLGLEGRAKGEFMKRQDIRAEGVVLLAGTELWDILETQGWQSEIPELPGIELIDPIKLLMEHLADLSIRNAQSLAVAA